MAHDRDMAVDESSPPVGQADIPASPDGQAQTVTDPLACKLTDIMAAVEAILFAAGYPVAYRKLSEVIGLPESELRLLLSHMAEGFGDRGIQLLLFPDTCQLCTKETYAPYIREALGIRRGGNLSASSMEVLAVIAYNQPVTRAYIDTIRGVDSSYAVSSLLDKGLIEATGRLEAPGRPMLYGTTDKFLRVFGLNDLSELPKTEPLAPADPSASAQGQDGDAACGQEDTENTVSATGTETDTGNDALVAQDAPSDAPPSGTARGG